MTIDRPNKPYVILESIPEQKPVSRAANRINPFEMEPE
jgi:hypothetical protein